MDYTEGTSITVANGTINYPYDIFTNGTGNHIIVQEPTALKYYKMDIYGTTIINLNPPLESTAVTSPSISGDLTKLYVVYRKGTENKIRTKYSTDGGVSWSYILPDLNTSSAPSSIECVFSKGNLHINYLVGTSVYHSYYKTNEVPPSWTIPFKVSEAYTASNPRIGVWNVGSANKVYITYNTTGNYLRWRGLNVTTGGWSPWGWYISSGVGNPVTNIGFAADDIFLYSFYMADTELRLTYITISNGDGVGTWTSLLNTYIEKMFSTTTANYKPYTAAWSTETNFLNKIVRIGVEHTPPPAPIPSKVFDVIYENPSLTPVNIVKLSAAGNDVHVVWRDNLSNNNLRYKYYDDVPIPPQNLTVTKSANNHPLLSWINPNPDAHTSNTYKIYRKNGCLGYWEPNPIAQITVLSYEDVSQSYCTAIPPAQCENLCNFEYKVKTVDLGSKESPYSDIVSVWLVGGPPQKSGVDNPDVVTVFEYSLGQNYPNPFNPTTTISYSLKSANEVRLKVYDMLGVEVASLVNENQEAGEYSIEFNASNLTSGIYFYTLTSGNFMATKKLILLK